MASARATWTAATLDSPLEIRKKRTSLILYRPAAFFDTSSAELRFACWESSFLLVFADIVKAFPFSSLNALASGSVTQPHWPSYVGF